MHSLRRMQESASDAEAVQRGYKLLSDLPTFPHAGDDDSSSLLRCFADDMKCLLETPLGCRIRVIEVMKIRQSISFGRYYMCREIDDVVVSLFVQAIQEIGWRQRETKRIVLHFGAAREWHRRMIGHIGPMPTVK